MSTIRATYGVDFFRGDILRLFFIIFRQSDRSKFYVAAKYTGSVGDNLVISHDFFSLGLCLKLWYFVEIEFAIVFTYTRMLPLGSLRELPFGQLELRSL